MGSNLIGKDVKRVDGVAKVTGSAEFVHDFKVDGMLYGALVKSPYAHARIKRINTDPARKIAGVRAILTGEDLPYKVGLYLVDKSILAVNKVRYYGEPVAAVAADNLEIAREAAGAIEVQYEELEPVLDVQTALEEGTPLVHENLGRYHYMQGVFSPRPGTNIANHFRLRRGDWEQGMVRADLVVENEFWQPQVQHVPLETHVAVGHYRPGGQVKIWTSAQSPFAVRNLLSAGLDIPHENIEVIVPYVGGGFGGKAGIHLEPLVTCLSRAAGGRPVKITASREEEFTTIPVRQGLLSRIKTGVSQEGKILAMEVQFLWDGGAYADYGVNIGRAAGYSGAGPYEVEAIKLDSITVYTNKPFGTAYRGFGHLEIHWSLERQMDLIARKLNMDPADFRCKNILRPGSTTITGEKIKSNSGRVDQCLEAVVQEIGWTGRPQALNWKKARGKVRAQGLALLHKAPAMPPNTGTGALLKMNENGSLLVSVSLIDYGQGTYTALAQVAAEEMGLPLDKVKVVWETNTDKDPYDWQTVASKGLFMTGNAVIRAAKDLKKQMKNVAAQVLRAPEDELDIAGEKIFLRHDPEAAVSFAEVAMGYTYPNGNSIGGPLIGRGHYIAQGLTNLDPETGQGQPALDWTYGAHGVEIELDLETGELDIINIVSAFDLGRVVNIANCRGQVYGGVVQGLGTAVMEEYIYDDRGRLLNPRLTDYKIPTCRDIPHQVKPIFIENPQPDGPYGARGVAEHPMISIPSAIGNALGMLGLQLKAGPLTAERILEEIDRLQEKTD